MKLKTEICVAMTKNYSQLTLFQRYQIEALKAAGHNQTSIAKNIGVNKSTISRELKETFLKEVQVQKNTVRGKHKTKPTPDIKQSLKGCCF
jgi:IS30 family transposase